MAFHFQRFRQISPLVVWGEFSRTTGSGGKLGFCWKCTSGQRRWTNRGRLCTFGHHSKAFKGTDGWAPFKSNLAPFQWWRILQDPTGKAITSNHGMFSRCWSLTCRRTTVSSFPRQVFVAHTSFLAALPADKLAILIDYIFLAVVWVPPVLIEKMENLRASLRSAPAVWRKSQNFNQESAKIQRRSGPLFRSF